MKTIQLLAILLMFSFTTIAQQHVVPNSKDHGIATLTDAKFYLIDGKIQSKPPKTGQDKSGWQEHWIDYFDVELDGYAFGDPAQAPRFYWILQDSNFKSIGTAFTHAFDFNNFILEDFSVVYGQDSTINDIFIDTIFFNFGHINHSGIPDTLAITIRELPPNNSPAANGNILWSTSSFSVDFTTSTPVSTLPVTVVPVGIKLPYKDRGVYIEVAFKAGSPLDSAAFLANYFDSGINCPALNQTGALESFTHREDSLQEGRTLFQSAYYSNIFGNPLNTYYDNLDIFYDCDTNGVYNRGTDEAYLMQNAAIGMVYSTGVYPVTALFTKEQATLNGVPLAGQVIVRNKSHGNISTYFWDFGDGDTSNIMLPTHSYTGNGPYNLCLTVSDGTYSDTYCDSVSIDSNGIVQRSSAGFTINIKNSTFGINEFKSAIRKVYPNPATSEINIQFDRSNIDLFDIQLIDQLGKTLIRKTNQKLSADLYNLDVSMIDAGVYYVSISTDEGVSNQIVVIK